MAIRSIDIHTCDLCSKEEEAAHKKRPSGWMDYILPCIFEASLTERKFEICISCRNSIAQAVEKLK